jgi:hypothetical protein
VIEVLAPHQSGRETGIARVKVTLIQTGPFGFGSWGDDHGELVDDVVLTYTANLTARRRHPVPINFAPG